jgi:hypothetical protein
MRQATSDKPSKPSKANDQAIKVAWTWKSQRTVKRSGLANYSDHLGTLSLSQVDGRIKHLYGQHWEILRPASFRDKSDTDLARKAIKREVTILIPAQVVRAFRAGRKPRSKRTAIEKAIKVLDASQQPINYHTVNGMLALVGMDATRQYIHGILNASGYTKAYSVGKVPYYQATRMVA